MKNYQLTVLCLAAALIAGALVFNGYTHMKGPSIVVYLGKDAKQPAMLPLPETNVVTGERAAFWWTVFCKAEQKQFVSDAQKTADAAVRAVYGNLK